MLGTLSLQVLDVFFWGGGVLVFLSPPPGTNMVSFIFRETYPFYQSIRTGSHTELLAEKQHQDVTADWASVRQPWGFEFWLRMNSEPRLRYKQKFIYKVTEVEVSPGRSEPAGLHGLWKQVTEAKEGPLELRRKKQGHTHLREEEEEQAPGLRWGKKG